MKAGRPYPPYHPAADGRLPGPLRRALARTVLPGIVLLAAAAAWIWIGGGGPAPASPDTTPLDAAGARELRRLEQQARTLEGRLRALRPRGTYVVIDAGRNRLRLVVEDRPVLEAICSTGSGRALADPRRNRLWVFDTPRGEFFIRAKHPNPVWIKPDWAFLEEGEPIPRSIAERMAPMELGAYAMDLGDGYLIHGTLYQRAIGLSITHGCIRLGDRDLETVYKAVTIGTPVYIY